MFSRTVIVLLSFCSVGYTADLAGVLSSVSGSVQTVRAGETAPHGARTADLIFVGDRVLTGHSPQPPSSFVPDCAQPEYWMRLKSSSMQTRCRFGRES